MSVYEYNRPVPLGAVATWRVVAVADRALSAFQTWDRARRTRAVLSALSDAQLADIGLHRGQIPQLAGELARV